MKQLNAALSKMLKLELHQSCYMSKDSYLTC